jgi:PAS domain S-box-containing protein
MFAGIEISWMTAGWAMVVAVYLTLALIYLVIAARSQESGSLAYLLFVAVALGAAGTAVGELALAHARTIEQYASVLRMVHIPLAFLLLPLPWFVYVLFRTGRPWLALLSNALWMAALVINAFSPHSRLYAEITALERIPFAGEAFTRAVGTGHAWRWIGQMTTLVILVFVLDAAVTLWNQGGRRRVVLIGGAVTLSSAIGVSHAALVSAGLIRSPYLVSVSFLFLLAAMAYELVDEALQAVSLERQVERQAAELQEQEERLRLASDSAALGLWSWSAGDVEIWMTSRNRDLLGLQSTVAATWPRVLECVHEEDRERVVDEARRLCDEGGQFESEFRVVRPEGAVRWMSSRGGVECGEGGVPSRTRGAVRDVTERREAQSALALQRAEVAHLSRVTTLGEMSNSIAHELNQPLTAILSNAQAALRFLGRDTPRLDEVEAALTAIVTQDRYASDVIDRLQLLLKKGERRTESLDISRLVDEVVELAEVELAREGVRVETETATDLPTVPGDRVQLFQVLLNVVRNGADAMTELARDERKIAIGAEASQEGVEITVTDRGTGISAEHTDEVFRPFFTTRAEGSGLGLAVSRTIVQMHGGKIWATVPEDGRGTAIHVLLPTQESAARQP